MRRLHGWLVTRFLPVWAKETILEENKRLRAELEQQRAENRSYAHMHGAWRRAFPRCTA